MCTVNVKAAAELDTFFFAQDRMLIPTRNREGLGARPHEVSHQNFEVSHFLKPSSESSQNQPTTSVRPSRLRPKIPISVTKLGNQGTGGSRNGHVEVHHVLEWDTT